MSRELTNKEVTTRKPHSCEWCAETIETGSHTHYRAYIKEGDFMSGWMHLECYDAMLRASGLCTWFDGLEWMPGDFQRGCDEMKESAK